MSTSAHLRTPPPERLRTAPPDDPFMAHVESGCPVCGPHTSRVCRVGAELLLLAALEVMQP